MHDPLTVAIADDRELASCEATLVYLDPVDGITCLHPGDGSIGKDILLVKDGG